MIGIEVSDLLRYKALHAGGAVGVAGGTTQEVGPKEKPLGIVPVGAHDPFIQHLSIDDRLDRLSMSNFLKVVEESLEKSGYSREDIDYLGLLRMKRSAFEYVANELGVHPYEQATYFEEWGHMGQNDSIVSIEEGLKSGKIKDGDVVVLAAAGIGWSWNAMTIKWGEWK